MLSYRHAFHAGNHADVLKHLVLLLLVQGMERKEAPFCYLESHAGAGLYDLTSPQAQKTAEHAAGIGRLWGLSEALPEPVADYLAAVRACNNGGDELRRYPGSPWLAARLLRPQDRLLLCELHPSELPLLKEALAGDRRAQLHREDGFQGLKAFLPPAEKRLLALIDPPYERKDEYAKAVAGLKEGHRRWPAGTFALWYPVLVRAETEKFLGTLRTSGIRKILRLELTVAADRSGPGMKGSGLAIVNPPWRLDEQLQALLPWLWRRLSPEGWGGTRLEWLVEE